MIDTEKVGEMPLELERSLNARWSVGDSNGYPNMMLLHGKVSSLPQIAEYLGSERRVPPNNSDIFRHYPELDD